MSDTGFHSAAAAEVGHSVLSDLRLFKKAGMELKQRPPDEAAARAVIQAYQEHRAEPWLTAFLLGCIRHDVGYDIVRTILLAGTPSAFGYAGKAMALIGGQRAAGDLMDILNSSTSWRIRQEAIYGLEELDYKPAVPFLIEAYSRGHLGPAPSISRLVAEEVTEQVLLGWLRSNNENDAKLACKVIEHRVKRLMMTDGHRVNLDHRARQLPGPEVAAAVADVLEVGRISLRPDTVALLRSWSSQS